MQGGEPLALVRLHEKGRSPRVYEADTLGQTEAPPYPIPLEHQLVSRWACSDRRGEAYSKGNNLYEYCFTWPRGDNRP